MQIGNQVLRQSTDLGMKPNGIKRYLPANQAIRDIEQKLASGMSVNDLTPAEYKQLNAHEKAETAAFIQESLQSKSNAELIARKIARGEQLTSEEERLMNEKYPDLKRKAQQAKTEGENLRSRLRSAKTKAEKQHIATGAMNALVSLAKESNMEAIDVELKMEATKKAIEDAEKEDEEGKGLMKVALQNTDIRPGGLFNAKA